MRMRTLLLQCFLFYDVMANQHWYKRLEAAGFTRIKYLKNIHSYNDTLHQVRNNLFTFPQVAKLVKRTGHKWCSFYRDNHSCTGTRYEDMLYNTTPYDPTLALDAFPENSVILFEGNSWLAEHINTIVCNTNDETHTWNLDGLKTNSLFSYLPHKNTVMLLISNDSKWTRNPQMIKRLWNELSLVPTIIVLGTLNWDFKHEHLPDRIKMYHEMFPTTPLLNYSGRRLPNNCTADFYNCKNIGIPKGHTCIPGPILRFTECLVRLLLQTIS